MSTVYFLARSSNTLARWTPQSARHAMGATIGVASYLGWLSKRKVTQLNMSQVTGHPAYDPLVQRLALISWRNYGRYVSDFMNFPHLQMDHIERNMLDLSEGPDDWNGHMCTALQAGRGAILATAHFGNWDLAGALVARHHQVSAVTETFRDDQLNKLLQDQRRQKGIGIIPMEGSMRRILRMLQENQLVGIVVDRPVAKDQGIEVQFFGRKTYVPSGPAALALKSGAAIVPGFVWYGHHNEFYTRAFKPIYPQEIKREERAQEVSRLTQRMYDVLEIMIREWPAQWYMFRQFWPTE